MVYPTIYRVLYIQVVIAGFLPSTVWNKIIFRYPWPTLPVTLSCPADCGPLPGAQHLGAGDSPEIRKMLEFCKNLEITNCRHFTGWFQCFFFVFGFLPLLTWGNDPIWRIFFRWSWKHQLVYYLYHLLKVSVLQKKSPGITKDPVMMFFMNVESSKI